jgi:adenine-specific DNA-methyltransferase
MGLKDKNFKSSLDNFIMLGQSNNQISSENINNISNNKIISLNKIKNKKEMGQVFTPLNIVNLILDNISYIDNIQNKTILEPSCGDGAFLKEIVKRYIEYCIKNKQNTTQIKNELESNIYGIELDKKYYEECIKNLNELCGKYDIKNIDWKIYNQDALIKEWDFKFDFIVGNPPYIRVHNLDIENRQFLKNNYCFCNSGSTDIYYAFYEYAIKNIKNTGKISFITPNSFMRNASGKILRRYILEHNLLENLIDFKDEQIFENASVYSAIMILSKDNIFSKFYEKNNFIDNVNGQDFLNKLWNFKLNLKNNKIKKQNIVIQNGFATLADKIYISKNFNIENKLLKPIVKGSKFDGNIIEKIIFPYEKINNRYRIIRSEKLKNDFPLCYNYFMQNKEKLLNRDIDKGYLEFYQYGRSQSIQNIHHKKLVLNTMVNDKIKFYEIDENIMVYSGLFIIADDLDIIKESLKSKEFYDYIQIVGKDLRGGWKSFNSKNVKEFLC